MTPSRTGSPPGFQVYPGARANYRATDFSLSSMLSMRMLDEYSVDARPGLR